jgi:hypothetical protein
MPGVDVSHYTRETWSPHQREERLAAFDDVIRNFVADAVAELQAGIPVLQLLFARDVATTSVADTAVRKIVSSVFFMSTSPLSAGSVTL